jgi:hypothetical protein
MKFSEVASRNPNSTIAALAAASERGLTGADIALAVNNAKPDDDATSPEAAPKPKKPARKLKRKPVDHCRPIGPASPNPDDAIKEKVARSLGFASYDAQLAARGAQLTRSIEDPMVDGDLVKTMSPRDQVATLAARIR